MKTVKKTVRKKLYSLCEFVPDEGWRISESDNKETIIKLYDYSKYSTSEIKDRIVEEEIEEKVPDIYPEILVFYGAFEHGCEKYECPNSRVRAEEMLENMKKRYPEARFSGVILQPAVEF